MQSVSVALGVGTVAVSSAPPPAEPPVLPPVLPPPPSATTVIGPRQATPAGAGTVGVHGPLLVKV
ncbi:MAG TPA: hypothetical protein DCQ30_02460 [Acidimicrobiaceae bacterium]|nr:hypothetical protein [Acidimicrobiaceae bacterium]